ncbi:MAG: hypothetical protein Q4B99_04300, partial [Clostridia bacterium]|nr:hypothetical protein [Clostridia bacterium]
MYRLKQLMIIVSDNVRRKLLDMRLKRPGFVKRVVAIVCASVCALSVLTLVIVALVRGADAQVVTAYQVDVSGLAARARGDVNSESMLWLEESPQDGVIDVVGELTISALGVSERIIKGAGQLQLSYGIGLYTRYGKLCDENSMAVLIGHSEYASGMSLSDAVAIARGVLSVSDGAGKTCTYWVEHNNVISAQDLEMTLEQIKDYTALCLVTYEGEGLYRVIRCALRATLGDVYTPQPFDALTPAPTPQTGATSQPATPTPGGGVAPSSSVRPWPSPNETPTPTPG